MNRIIIKNGNICELDVPLKYANKLYNQFAIRHPNAFYLRTRVKGMANWDGTVKFITKSGQFKIGLLPSVYEACKKLGLRKIEILDMRKPVPTIKHVQHHVGNYKLRPEQIKAVKSVVYNKVGDIPFHIGVLNLTVNFGKCNGKNTLVYTDKGLIKIKDLVNKDGSFKLPFKLLGMDGQYHTPSAGIFNRIKAIRITTENGYSQICGYDNHRFYTVTKDGKLDWVYAKNLKKGDSIPLYKSTPSVSPDSCKDKNLAYLLGVICGDGHIHIKPRNNIHVSVSGQSKEVFDSIVPIWNRYTKTPVVVKPHRRFNGYHISKSDKLFSNLLSTEYPELLGLSDEKYIPNKIMNASSEVKCNFIAGLFDTDGHNESSKRNFSWTSVCKKNVKLIQLTLLTLGISSKISKKKTLCNGKRSIAWRLHIYSRDYDHLLSIIPLKVPYKKVKDRECRNNYGHRLPIEFAKKIYKYYRSLGLSTRKSKLSSIDRNQIRHPNRLNIEAAKRLLELYPNEELIEFMSFSETVIWDKVKSIEVIREYDCYDISVPDVKHYITQGFISHNTLVMAALYLSFKRQLKTLLITNDSDWLQQSKLEFKSYLPNEPITFIQGKVPGHWNQFSIGMVQSLSKNIKYYQGELSTIDMVLVDEADQASSKTYQTVLSRMFNARVRIGMSGTIYMSKLAKDKLKNMNLEAFFGRVLSEFSLKQSIDKGYSTKTIVKSIEPKRYYGNWQSIYIDYESIYKDTILDHPAAKEAVYDRLKFNLAYGRIPALVVCKFIKHAEELYKYLKDKLPDYKFACVHVNTKDKLRRQIMQDFREGKIDILISTTIIARGKNFPLLKYMLNAASMDAREKTIQFLGRLVRTNESKSKAYLDDLIYPGDYLRKHGYHRRKYYKDQHLKVLVIR